MAKIGILVILALLASMYALFILAFSGEGPPPTYTVIIRNETARKLSLQVNSGGYRYDDLTEVGPNEVSPVKVEPDKLDSYFLLRITDTKTREQLYLRRFRTRKLGFFESTANWTLPDITVRS
ncbi:MAG: hypothetical protein JSS72_10220 [Armatimonadetes bacterium]|nr:hypothetical protein [Armatimonadota bacterium]